MSTNEKTTSRTRSRAVFAVIALCLALFQIISTEMHVADLRSRGFTDVAVSSARNHAYFPLIGAIVGALLFTGIVRVIRQLLKRPEQ